MKILEKLFAEMLQILNVSKFKPTYHMTRRIGYPVGSRNLGGIVGFRVVVDYDLCESNAICMQVAPEVFEVRDDDFLYLLTEEPGEELRAKVEESVQRCPKQAIAISEG